MRCVEPLENRCLLSASTALAARLAVENHPTVVAASDTVSQDRAKLAADAAQAADVRANHRTTFKTIAANGKITIANDRAAVKAATDDAAHDAAVVTLNADKAKLKADLSAEKSAAKQDAATWKTTLHDDVRALRADLKNFSVTRKSIKSDVKSGAKQFAAAAKAAGADGNVTDDELSQLATDVKAALDGIVLPSQDTIQALLSDVKGAFSDKSISSAELESLITDVRAVATSANVTQDEVDAIYNDVKKIVGSLDLSFGDLLKLGADFVNLYLNP